MPPRSHGFRQTLTAWRRTVSVALLALQAVIALSPVIERRHEASRGAHVEALGSRHLLAHDEATCAVCSARTLAIDLPAPSLVLFARTGRGGVEVSYEDVVPAVHATLGNASRAPPTLG